VGFTFPHTTWHESRICFCEMAIGMASKSFLKNGSKRRLPPSSLMFAPTMDAPIKAMVTSGGCPNTRTARRKSTPDAATVANSRSSFRSMILSWFSTPGTFTGEPRNQPNVPFWIGFSQPLSISSVLACRRHATFNVPLLDRANYERAEIQDPSRSPVVRLLIHHHKMQRLAHQ
jgi:hypothetical protein